MCNKNGPQIRHSNRPRKPPIIAGCNTKIALLWFNPPVLAPQCRCLHQFGSFIRWHRKPLSQMHHYILVHKYANPHTHRHIHTQTQAHANKDTQIHITISPHKMMMMDHINHNSSEIFWQQTLIVRLDFSGMCVAGHNALMSRQTEVSKFLVLLISTEHNAHNILTWTHFCVQHTGWFCFLCCRKHRFDEKTNTIVLKQANS